MTDWLNRCHFGDCIETMRSMPDAIVQTCVTSPPYFGLRDYGHAGQIGLEETPREFVAKLVEVCREVRRVLRDDGTLWLNLGDSYAGSWGARGRGEATNAARPDLENKHGTAAPNRFGFAPMGIKPKDLMGIPWRVAFALQEDGWYLRQDIIWHKPNPMPESVTDRCTKAHEYIFLLSKSPSYYCDMGAIKEQSTGQAPGNVNPQKAAVAYAEGDERHRTKSGLNAFADRARAKRDSFKRDKSKRAAAIPGQSVGTHRADRHESEYDIDTRNKRSVWTVATAPYKGAHFATFPTELIEPCILAGAPSGGVVLDPFFGSGTTGQVAQTLGRQFIGCELNPEYKALQDERLRQPGFIFEEAA